MIFILLTATVLLMDLGIKFTIENADPSLFPRTIEKTKGLIMLHRNHNEGFPFGALKEKKELVKQLPLAVVSAVAGIFAWLFPRKGYIVEKAGLNLGDICVFLGAAILLAAELARTIKEES